MEEECARMLQDCGYLFCRYSSRGRQTQSRCGAGVEQAWSERLAGMTKEKRTRFGHGDAERRPQRPPAREERERRRCLGAAGRLCERRGDGQVPRVQDLRGGQGADREGNAFV